MPAPTTRLTRLPPYVFSWLDTLKARARARGADLIDLGIGNPDQPTPYPVLDEMAAALGDPRTHGYPPFRGTPAFLEAAAGYLHRRFGVELDPATELLAVSGGKEGIAHLTMAYADASSVTLVPDIHYPVHARMTLLAGSEVHWLPLRAERGFLPDLSAVPAEVCARARLLVVNYPNNPTGAVATPAFWEEAVAFARRHDLVLVSDMAYAELSFDGAPAPSVFAVPAARHVAVEIHSCSKSFNMAGARVGFAAGSADAIAAMYAVRMTLGYGTPAAIQAGAAHALAHAEALTPAVAARYRERRDLLVEGFRALGWEVVPPAGTMFLWLRVPRGATSEAFVESLIERCGVVVAPGSAFGPGGEGWFRVSLVAEAPRLREALARLAGAGVRGD